MERIKVTANFKSVVGSDLMQTVYVEETKPSSETWEQFDARIWQRKVHTDTTTGQVFIPPFALKNAFEVAGKWLNEKIQGEGKKTYTDRFRKGVLVLDRMMLTHKGKPVTIADAVPNTIMAPVTGRRGDGARVPRVFPTIGEG